MSFQRNRISFEIGSQFTKTGKKMLLVYGVIYIIELIAEHWFNLPFFELFQLYPFGSENFHFWQFFTHHFIQNPSNPIDFLICCLIFFFFAGTVERSLGTGSFL